MSETTYGVVLEIQQPEIEAYCFGLCGKIIFGAMLIPIDGGILTILPCKQTKCPFLHTQQDTPINMPNGWESVLLRRLVDAPQKAVTE